MRRIALVLLALCLVAVGPAARTRAAEVGTQPTGSTAVNPWAEEEQASALIRDYLAREGWEATRDANSTYPVYTATVKMTNATHRLRVVIDTKRGLVYLFLNRYLMEKPDSPGLPKVLQRLMEENWNLNIGKFEWDKTDGEIRYSYCFTTENGVGYESFEAICRTLLDTGDRLWPELRALTDQ